jgi:hypothetical protein
LSNKFKEIKEEKVEPVAEKKASSFKNLLSGSFLSKEKVTESLPFIFFLTFLGVCYIANGYQTEKVIRQLYSTNNELKELRSEYITTKSDLMYISKQSQVAKATSGFGLVELMSPPKKIVLTKKDKEELFND